MHAVRILHISDLHDKAERESDTWRRRRVLGDAWKQNLDALIKDGPADVLCFTGDLADWGRQAEYDSITSFLEETWTRVGVPWERVFVVPGNHDMDRTVEPGAWETLRAIEPHEDALFSSWMAGGRALRGIDDGLRDAVLRRQSAYRAWVATTLARPELVPVASSPHPRLGYRATIALPQRPFPVHVIGLDSAWLAGDDHDNGKLRLTDDQVGRLASAPTGTVLDGFRVALVHHPLDHLADASRCRRLLAERVDILLRGHLHETDPSTWKDPNRELAELVAGCLYEHDGYPNVCHMLTAQCDDHGKPMHYDLHLRAWSPRGHWYDDNGLSDKVHNGRLRWWSRPETPASGPDAPAPAAPVPATRPAPAEPDARELRKTLSRYFDTIPRIRILLNDAGVDLGRVSFDHGAETVWDGGIMEAKRSSQLRRLLEIACDEYPEAADLRALASRHGA